MADRKHYNPNTGLMEKCNAQAGNCPFGGQHFEDDALGNRYADMRNELEVEVELGNMTREELDKKLGDEFGEHIPTKLTYKKPESNIKVSIALTNLRDYNNGNLNYEWVELPASQEELDDAYNRVSRNGEAEVFISDVEDENGMLSDVQHMEYKDAYNISEYLESLDEYDANKLTALIEYEGGSLTDHLDKDLDDYTFYEGITNAYDLGYIQVEDGAVSADTAETYVDLESLGRDLVQDYDEEYPSYELEDIGRNYLYDNGVDPYVSNYFDYEAFGYDLSVDGYFSKKGFLVTT